MTHGLDLAQTMKTHDARACPHGMVPHEVYSRFVRARPQARVSGPAGAIA